MAGGASGEDAVHHVNAEAGVFDDFFGRAYAHEVARLACREVLDSGLDNLAGHGTRLADTQAAYGIAREANFDGAFCGFPAQSVVHAALDDSEQGLGRTGLGVRVASP